MDNMDKLSEAANDLTVQDAMLIWLLDRYTPNGNFNVIDAIMIAALIDLNWPGRENDPEVRELPWLEKVKEHVKSSRYSVGLIFLHQSGVQAAVIKLNDKANHNLWPYVRWLNDRLPTNSIDLLLAMRSAPQYKDGANDAISSLQRTFLQ